MTDFTISSERERMDFDLIHDFLSQSYWAKGIPREVLQTAMRNSLCFGVFAGEGRQIGFARVISDFATFAYLADVFVCDADQGQGAAKCLMAAISGHPQLQGLRRFVLATRDAHGLYERFGFRSLANPETFMERWVPDIYFRSE